MTNKEPDMSAGEESEMSEQAKNARLREVLEGMPPSSPRNRLLGLISGDEDLSSPMAWMEPEWLRLEKMYCIESDGLHNRKHTLSDALERIALAAVRNRDDAEQLARLRSHPQRRYLERDLEQMAADYGYRDLCALLLQLLRGDTGQGG